MDNKAKCIAWAGNICQKIEAICSEVDNIIMPQETIRCVENHLQNVGENVKQFCTELMQDVLPPSPEDPARQLDSSFRGDEESLNLNLRNYEENQGTAVRHSSIFGSLEGADLRITCKKISDTRISAGPELSVDKNSIKDVETELDLQCGSDLPMEKMEKTGSVLYSIPISITSEKISNNVISAALGVSADENPIKKIELELEQQCGRELPKGTGSASGSISMLSPNYVHVAQCNEKELLNFQNGSSADLPDNMIQSISESEEAVDLDHEALESLVVSPSCIEGANQDVGTESNVEALQFHDNMNVEESCIFVDCEELHLVSAYAGKCTICKKKLQKGLCPDGHRQCAASCEDLDSASDQDDENSCEPSILNNKSQTSDPKFCEFDWVLV